MKYEISDMVKQCILEASACGLKLYDRNFLQKAILIENVMHNPVDAVIKKEEEKPKKHKKKEVKQNGTV